MERRTHSRPRPGPGRRKEAMGKTTKIIGRMTKTIGEGGWEVTLLSRRRRRGLPYLTQEGRHDR